MKLSGVWTMLSILPLTKICNAPYAMTIEKQLNGSWLCATVDNTGHRIAHVYYGYTKAEAKDEFLKELAAIIIKELKLKN